MSIRLRGECGENKENMGRESKEEWNRKSAKPMGKKTKTATPQWHCQYTERTYTRADVWGVKFEEEQELEEGSP